MATRLDRTKKSDEEKEWEKQREREEVEFEDPDTSSTDGPITYYQHNHKLERK